MTIDDLENLLEMKRQRAKKAVEKIAENRGTVDDKYQALSETKRVSLVESDAKYLIEQTKALETILEDEEELQNVVNGRDEAGYDVDWTDYVEPYKIAG